MRVAVMGVAVVGSYVGANARGDSRRRRQRVQPPESLAALDNLSPVPVGNMRDVIEGRLSELETEVGAIMRLARAST
jgi:hypothetical protein